MSLVFIMGLFLFKHGLLCHVIDFGYSRSRRGAAGGWYLGLFSHAIAELLVSLYILRTWSWEVASVCLGLELAALLLTGLIERRAPLRKLLVTHLQCELIVIGSYALIAGRMVAMGVTT